MLRKDHSHSKPSVGTVNLLAAVHRHQISLANLTIQVKGGDSGRNFSDCYPFLLRFGESDGEDHANNFGSPKRRARKLLRAFA